LRKRLQYFLTKKYLSYRGKQPPKKKFHKNEQMIDKRTEEEIVDRWYAGEYVRPMAMSDFTNACKNGIEQCSEFCQSRHYVGEDNCYCVRSIFPHPDFFLLYSELRKEKVLSELLLTIKKD